MTQKKIKYYKYANKIISPNDFEDRERITYFKTKDNKTWHHLESNNTWRRCSDPTHHGIYIKEISKEDLFIEML